MGKSFVASQFKRCGIAVFDADKAVHSLISKHGKAVEEILDHFPDANHNGEINRVVLGEKIFQSNTKRLLLESILHPLVFEAQNQFIATQRRLGRRYILLDVPLLFETGVNRQCDLVVVVTASRFIQKRRVLKRKSMTETKLRNILASQVEDRKKRLKADFIIYTGGGKAHTSGVIRKMVKNGFYRKGNGWVHQG